MKPFIVGISGPSCAGKSTLVDELQHRFPNSRIVHLDDFWHDPATFPPVRHHLFRNFTNWELPQNLNFQLLHKVLRRLQKGWRAFWRAISFERPIIFVEGFLLFHDAKIREMMDLKVYLDIPDETVVQRRMERKRFEFEGMELYYREVVLDEYRRHGLPTMRYADTVIDGTKTVHEVADMVERLVQFSLADRVTWIPAAFRRLFIDEVPRPQDAEL
jgi:uridine kinase